MFRVTMYVMSSPTTSRRSVSAIDHGGRADGSPFGEYGDGLEPGGRVAGQQDAGHLALGGAELAQLVPYLIGERASGHRSRFPSGARVCSESLAAGPAGRVPPVPRAGRYRVVTRMSIPVRVRGVASSVLHAVNPGGLRKVTVKRGPSS